jgi:mercuric ion transport protein
MWRDRWFAVGVVGTIVSCLACLTPVTVLALGTVGLGAWTGHLDTVLVLLLVAFMALTAYRYWIARRAAS